MKQTYYLCIDLKSFYASVECVERNLDPMTTNLVVADPARKEKTICLAVSPAMKALGVKNRCRIFEIPKNIDYIQATPRMQKYIDYSADIYELYLGYFNKVDIYVYSIDEVFIDITPYLNLYKKTPKEMAAFLIEEIKKETGIPATCGVGTNLYLAKIALDITAKHAEDFIGELTEESYKEKLWKHTPLTDFWRIGKGTEEKLNAIGLFTMFDIAHCNEDILYEIFGIDAELLIDHSKGIEPVTLYDIKHYKSKKHSIGSGQVLMRDYTYKEAEVIISEMTEDLVLELVGKNLTTNSIHLEIKYSRIYNCDPSRGTASLVERTNNESIVRSRMLELYKKIVLRDLKIRKITISFNNTKEDNSNKQISFFDKIIDKSNSYEPNLNEAIIHIKEKFGKNSILKGLDLLEEATTIERNTQIGGHRSGISSQEDGY